MGVSIHVAGIRFPDEKHKKMIAVWDACKEAGVEVPDDVLQYFDWEDPEELGLTIDLEHADYNHCIEEWSAEGSAGYTISLADLPDKITHVRVYNSW